MPTKIIQKSKAYHQQAKKNEYYIQRKTNLNAYLKRIESQFENNKQTIILHGLGAAILKTIKIANIISQKYWDVETEIQTSSQNVVDLVWNQETQQEQQGVNQRSAIHIKLIRQNQQ